MIKLFITLFVKIAFCSEHPPTNAPEEQISYSSLLDGYKRYFEESFLSGIDEKTLLQHSHIKENQQFMIKFLNLMCKLDHKNISKIHKIIVNVNGLGFEIIHDMHKIALDQYLKMEHDEMEIGFEIIYDKDKIALDQYLEKKHKEKDLDFEKIYDKDKIALNKNLKKKHEEMNLIEQLLEGVSYIHSKNIVHNALGSDKLKVTEEKILMISKFYFADDLTSKINELNVPSKNSEHELKNLNTERKKLFLKDIRSVGNIISKILKYEDIDNWEENFYFGGNIERDIKSCNLLKEILMLKLTNEALIDLICSCYHPSLDIVPSASELLDSFRRIRNSEK